MKIKKLMITFLLLFVLYTPLFGVEDEIVPNNEITFTWDANTEDDLAGYKVYTRQINTNDYTIVADVTTNEAIINIEPDTYISVTAYDKNYNESEKSEEWFYEVNPPAIPQGLQLKIHIEIDLGSK